MKVISAPFKSDRRLGVLLFDDLVDSLHVEYLAQAADGRNLYDFDKAVNVAFDGGITGFLDAESIVKGEIDFTDKPEKGASTRTLAEVKAKGLSVDAKKVSAQSMTIKSAIRNGVPCIVISGLPAPSTINRPKSGSGLKLG